MFTRCPACLTQFRVHARQLSAAAGRVRCGACGQAFDALSRLSDEPQPPVTDPYNHSGEPLRRQEDELEDFDLPRGLHGRDDEAVTTPGVSASAATPGSADVELDWPLTDSAPRRSRYGLWTVLAVALILVLAVQLAWFQRDRLYDHVPALVPWVQELCERLDCEVYRHREPQAIELINRDVREHPVYEEALLVNATIANRSASRQPYPRIQLALYDTDGRALAYREFAPEDYLDASLPVSAGMPPDTPVHVVLELGAGAPGAVSFEFGFL